MLSVSKIELSAFALTFVVLLWYSWRVALMSALAFLLFLKVRDEIVAIVVSLICVVIFTLVIVPLRSFFGLILLTTSNTASESSTLESSFGFITGFADLLVAVSNYPSYVINYISRRKSDTYKV